MLSRRSILLISGVFLAEVRRRSRSVGQSDQDVRHRCDGTLDLAEVKKAAASLFARLDRDHDGTLDRRELAGRLSAREFAAADPDHDGTLTLDEYLAVVKQRFSAANRDSDGTLDAKELNAGRTRAVAVVEMRAAIGGEDLRRPCAERAAALRSKSARVLRQSLGRPE